MNDRNRNQQRIEAVTRALESGVVFVDGDGEIIGSTPEARRRWDGQLRTLALPLDRTADSIDCFIATVCVPVDGKGETVGVVQLIAEDSREDSAQRALHQAVGAAVADVLAEPSWFVEALTEKLKAWCRTTQPGARTGDIEVLTAREREILALICDGRSDAEMGQQLGLSQNTVRNHVASLFRKIGVNRRSAAIIWARERGLTRYDIQPPAGARRSRPAQ